MQWGIRRGWVLMSGATFAQLSRARRPKPPPKKKQELKMPRHIYLSRFGRSVSGRVAQALMDNSFLRGTLTCTDPACCPNGASSMTAGWRQHAVRSRARELDELDRMPDASWRLNHVARLAERAADVACSANEVLAKSGVKERVPEASFRALTTVADAIRVQSNRRAG